MKRWLPMLMLAATAAGCGGSGADRRPVLDPAQATLQEVQSSIFTPRCATFGCHVGNDAPFDLDLSAGQAWGNIVGVASAERPEFDRITPGDPADSYLYMKVSDDSRIFGDPMPAQAAPLSGQQLQLLQDWISEGASR